MVCASGLADFFILFFFSSRRRHTRSKRDWSSDVCSSDLLGQAELQVKEGYLGLAVRYADGVRTMPFLQQTNDLEYRLTSDIRRSEERRVGKECRSRWSPDQ